MLVLGFGGRSELTPEQEEYIAEQMAQRYKELLEMNGWYSSFGLDPVIILINLEEMIENGDAE
jgi:hypothetical protein